MLPRFLLQAALIQMLAKIFELHLNNKHPGACRVERITIDPDEVFPDWFLVANHDSAQALVGELNSALDAAYVRRPVTARAPVAPDSGRVIARLASCFSDMLREELGDYAVGLIARDNSVACAKTLRECTSHRYCDADEIMSDAFDLVAGIQRSRVIEQESALGQIVAAMREAAWTKAQGDLFGVPRPEDARPGKVFAMG